MILLYKNGLILMVWSSLGLHILLLLHMIYKILLYQVDIIRKHPRIQRYLMLSIKNGYRDHPCWIKDFYIALWLLIFDLYLFNSKYIEFNKRKWGNMANISLGVILDRS